MTRSAPFLLALLLLLFTTPARQKSAAQDAARAGFPLMKGSAWLYQGLVRWPLHPESSPEVVEQTMTWQMEVVDVIPRGHVTAAVMRGHPADLFSPRPLDAAPSDYVIVQVGADKFYEVRGDPERVAQVLARLRDPSDLLVDLVHDDELVLDLPLIAGKRFCEAFQMTRQDGAYCWVVESARQVQPGDVVGVSATQDLTEYQLRKGALTGDIIVGFVPGLGITHFTGAHRGVRWEADLQLVEYHQGES